MPAWPYHVALCPASYSTKRKFVKTCFVRQRDSCPCSTSCPARRENLFFDIVLCRRKSV